jgi:transposase InsO family protein
MREHGIRARHQRRDKATPDSKVESIEVFDHRKRRHSTLGDHSPVQFLNDCLNAQQREKRVA